MPQRPQTFVAISCLLTLLGCQAARVVSRTSDGGVIAIPANNDLWPFHFRSKAESLIAKQCPEGYVIEDEEEVVVGQTTTVHQDQASNTNQITKHASFTTGASTTTASTSDQKEWRIHYRKKRAGE